MKTALIGYTGLVGSNFDRQFSFDMRYNSSNIESMRNESFDVIWCAGVRAAKWWANSNPEEDRRSIDSLLDVLDTVKCGHFVLISTVDVFHESCGKDEDCIPNCDLLRPYGLHRLHVENFVKKLFLKCTIVRLPGIYGDGLKKNAIFDLITGNNIENINPQSCFQFYNLDNIYRDCMTAVEYGLSIVHFAVEPITMREVAKEVFGCCLDEVKVSEAALYDMHTKYASIFGARGRYIVNKQGVLEGLTSFVHCQRQKAWK